MGSKVLVVTSKFFGWKRTAETSEDGMISFPHAFLSGSPGMMAIYLS